MRDLSALRELSLDVLDVAGASNLTDISALRGAPLRELILRQCSKIADYTPVLTLARLERLSCDVLPAELLPLRESATLQSIDADAYRPAPRRRVLESLRRPRGGTEKMRA